MTIGTAGTADPLAAPRWVRIMRDLGAPPYRVFRAWSHPEELARWFPERVEGSLAPGTRTILVWPDRRVWWDVVVAEADGMFSFRWPWTPDASWVTTVTIRLEPRGAGTKLSLEDGPFDLRRPAVLEAWAECNRGWGEAIALLRAHLDFSADLRSFR